MVNGQQAGREEQGLHIDDGCDEMEERGGGCCLKRNLGTQGGRRGGKTILCRLRLRQRRFDGQSGDQGESGLKTGTIFREAYPQSRRHRWSSGVGAMESTPSEQQPTSMQSPSFRWTLTSVQLRQRPRRRRSEPRLQQLHRVSDNGAGLQILLQVLGSRKATLIGIPCFVNNHDSLYARRGRRHHPRSPRLQPFKTSFAGSSCEGDPFLMIMAIPPVTKLLQSHQFGPS